MILRPTAGAPYNGVALVSPHTLFMLRNVFIVLVLAVLSAGPVSASSGASANAHRRTSSSAAPRKTTRHSPARARQPRTASHSTRGTAYSAGYRGGRSSRTSRRRPLTLAQRRAMLESARAVAKPASFERNRFTMPPPLRGSFESLARQNERAEADGLERILDEQDLSSRIEQRLLVPVPASSALAVNTNLPEPHRYCRPWTANFLSDLSHAHALQFHKPIEVSSAVRTVEYQRHLMLTNGNAAAAEGDVVSPHLTGGTVDIVKQGMNRKELGWMRNWLLAQQLAGTIDVEEEFRQRCFHITVYRNYTSPPPSPALKPRRAGAAAPADVASGVSNHPSPSLPEIPYAPPRFGVQSRANASSLVRVI